MFFKTPVPQIYLASIFLLAKEYINKAISFVFVVCKCYLIDFIAFGILQDILHWIDFSNVGT